MVAQTMGKVHVTAKIENLKDIYAAEVGILPVEQARQILVTDALVDTGTTGLSLPRRLIASLGLEPQRMRRAKTSAGVIDVQLYGAVRLTIQDRECLCDVTEVPNECTVLIGQVPLEVLDFIVDPVNQRLIGNPAHGGEQMIELYLTGVN